MKNYKKLVTVMSAFALAFCLVGCDRTVTTEKEVDVRNDGSVKTETEKVTQNPDGTVTKTEETKKSEPVTP